MNAPRNVDVVTEFSFYISFHALYNKIQHKEMQFNTKWPAHNADIELQSKWVGLDISKEVKTYTGKTFSYETENMNKANFSLHLCNFKHNLSKCFKGKPKLNEQIHDELYDACKLHKLTLLCLNCMLCMTNGTVRTQTRVRIVDTGNLFA